MEDFLCTFTVAFIHIFLTAEYLLRRGGARAAGHRARKTKNALPFAAASMGLCAISLLGQIFEYNNRVNVQDWSALLDTSYAVLFCAAVLVALALVLNIAACLRAGKQ